MPRFGPLLFGLACRWRQGRDEGGARMKNLIAQIPTDLQPDFRRLIRHDLLFQKYFHHRAGKRSTFYYLFNLSRVALLKNCRDVNKLGALAEFWCSKWADEGHKFDRAEWATILTKVQTGLIKTGWVPLELHVADPKKYNSELTKERLLRFVEETKLEFPAITELTQDIPTALPSPSQPPCEKWRLYDSQKKAQGSLAANRPDFKLEEGATPQEWHLWTERHLLSISYFAICAGFSLSELFFVQSQFIQKHSMTYNLSADVFLWIIAESFNVLAPHGAKMRNKMEEHLAGRLSSPKRKRREPDLKLRHRRMAQLKLEGMIPARIAKTLNVATSTVTRCLQRLVDQGGIERCFPDLSNPFSTNLARDLFVLCKSNRHPLTALQANSVADEVADRACKFDLKDWFNISRMRKALNQRRRSPKTNTFSDSKTSVEIVW